MLRYGFSCMGSLSPPDHDAERLAQVFNLHNLMAFFFDAAGHVQHGVPFVEDDLQQLPGKQVHSTAFVFTKFMGHATPCRSIFFLMSLSIENLLFHLLDTNAVDHVPEALRLRPLAW